MKQIGCKNTPNCKKGKNKAIGIGLDILFFIICYALASFFPNYTVIFQILMKVLTYLYYISLSLSIAGIAYWNDKNVFVAIFKSIKLFYKKFLLVLPVFMIFYAVFLLLSFLLCVIFYAIGLYFNFLTEQLKNAFDAVINIYALFIIINLYLGIQIGTIEETNE